MTPTGHNKILGVLHLAYGGLAVLVLIVAFIFLLAMLASNNSTGEPISIGPFAILVIAIVVINLLFVGPSLLAGYAFLKRKRWAKTIGVIAAAVAGLSFPLGTALCVYTLWFLFGESGRFLYHKAAYALPPAGRELERGYIPPSAPPDWR